MRLSIVLSLLTFVCTGGLAKAASCRFSPNALAQSQSSSAEVLRKIQLDEFDRDPQAYCRRHVLLRYLNANQKLWPEGFSCEGQSAPELEALANRIRKNTLDRDNAWRSSLIPTEESLEASLKMSFSQMMGAVEEKEIPDLQEARKYFERLREPSDFDLQKVASKVDLLANAKIQSQEQRLGALERHGLCAHLSLVGSDSCSQGLDIINQNFAPRKGAGQMMNLPSWKKILSERKYQKGLRIAGLKILSRLESNSDSTANVFDDIKESFTQSGLSPEEATDAAFKTLGVVANGGASSCQRALYLTRRDDSDINNTGHLPAARTTGPASLCLIGAGMNVLDFRKSQKGWPAYSYPNQIQAKCNYPKPYFFWMAADLAHSLKKDYGLDSQSAAAATFVAQKLYQVNRDVNGSANQGLDAVLNKSAFDPVHQVVRMDLAFAASGATFGASDSSPPPPLNVDASFRQLLVDGPVLPPESRPSTGFLNQVQNLYRWNQIFSPNSAFDAFRK